MCNACGNLCCGSDEFGGCGCDHCYVDACNPVCDRCGERGCMDLCDQADDDLHIDLWLDREAA